MPRSKSRFLMFAAAALALGGCDKVELFGLYVANLGTEAVVKAPLPIELPYQDHDGKIVVEASVNGRKPVGFLLDTSASLLSLLETDSTRHLDLDLTGAHRIGSAGNAAAPFGARQDGLEISMGDLSLREQTALALAASGLGCGPRKAHAFPFGGVIGHDILRRFVVEVDRDRRVIRLHDPQAYRYRGRGQVVPISFDERQPFVEALITPTDGPSYSARLQLDTGADVELALVSGDGADIAAPAIGQVTRSNCTVAGEANYRSGPSVEIRLGDHLVTSAVSYAVGQELSAAGQNGRIGARLLARFNIVLDYARERIILERRSAATLAKGDSGANGPARLPTLRHNAS